MSVYQVRLLTVCKAYQELTGITESALSNKLFGNGLNLTRIREGSRFRMSTYEAAIIWMNDNWPKGCRKKWPKGVERLRMPIAIGPRARGERE